MEIRRILVRGTHMRWPFVLRRVHVLETEKLEIELAATRARCTELLGERNYWRTRAEKFLDADRARAGVIHEPTMVETPKRPNAAASLIGAMAMTETPLLSHNGVRVMA